jgi:hypothetical protein
LARSTSFSIAVGEPGVGRTRDRLLLHGDGDHHALEILGANKRAPLFLDGPNPIGQASAFAALDPWEKLSAGIGVHEHTLLKVETVAGQCAFIRDGLKFGGKDYDEPLWNLSVYAATFMDDGHALAYKLSNQHNNYQYAETETKWACKLKERDELNFGWSSCKAIHDNGYADLAACSHRATPSRRRHQLLNFSVQSGSVQGTQAARFSLRRSICRSSAQRSSNQEAVVHLGSNSYGQIGRFRYRGGNALAIYLCRPGTSAIWRR